MQQQVWSSVLRSWFLPKIKMSSVRHKLLRPSRMAPIILKSLGALGTPKGSLLKQKCLKGGEVPGTFSKRDLPKSTVTLHLLKAVAQVSWARVSYTFSSETVSQGTLSLSGFRSAQIPTVLGPPPCPHTSQWVCPLGDHSY